MRQKLGLSLGPVSGPFLFVFSRWAVPFSGRGCLPVFPCSALAGGFCFFAGFRFVCSGLRLRRGSRKTSKHARGRACTRNRRDPEGPGNCRIKASADGTGQLPDQSYSRTSRSLTGSNLQPKGPGKCRIAAKAEEAGQIPDQSYGRSDRATTGSKLQPNSVGNTGSKLQPRGLGITGLKNTPLRPKTLNSGGVGP